MLPTTFYGNQKQPLSRSNAWPTTNALENTKFPELHAQPNAWPQISRSNLSLAAFMASCLPVFMRSFVVTWGRGRELYTPWNTGVGKWVAFWKGLLVGAMFVFGRVTWPITLTLSRKLVLFRSLCMHEQLERLEQPLQKQVATFFIVSNNFGMTSLHGLWLFWLLIWGAPQKLMVSPVWSTNARRKSWNHWLQRDLRT